jgi:hypothetical protein
MNVPSSSAEGQAIHWVKGRTPAWHLLIAGVVSAGCLLTGVLVLGGLSPIPTLGTRSGIAMIGIYIAIVGLTVALFVLSRLTGVRRIGILATGLIIETPLHSNTVEWSNLVPVIRPGFGRTYVISRAPARGIRGDFPIILTQDQVDAILRSPVGKNWRTEGPSIRKAGTT